MAEIINVMIYDSPSKALWSQTRRSKHISPTSTPVLLLCVCPLFPPTFISSVMEDCNWIKSDSVRTRTRCGCTAPPRDSAGRTSVTAVCPVSRSAPRGAGFWAVLTSSHVLLWALHQVNVRASSRSLSPLPFTFPLQPVSRRGDANTLF